MTASGRLGAGCSAGADSALGCEALRPRCALAEVGHAAGGLRKARVIAQAEGVPFPFQLGRCHADHLHRRQEGDRTEWAATALGNNEVKDAAERPQAMLGGLQQL